MRNNPTPVNKLIKHWIFQHVLHKGKSIGFWEEPLSNRWEHLFKNKDALQKLMKRGKWPMLIMQKLYKMYKNQHTTDIWESTYIDMLGVSKDGYGLVFDMGPEFFYFSLFHNKELETTLNSINNR